jgi:hypothetical protein
MNDTYIVSFVAGTSGRFLSNILWNMINNSTAETKYTMFNSAHYEKPWTKNWDVKLDEPSIEWSVNGPTAYNIFNFTSDIGIMTSHTYPNWDIVRERFPKTKIIIITYTENDIPEIVGNLMYKNGFDLFFADKNRKSMTFNHICEIYKELFNDEYKEQDLSLFKLEQIFNKMLDFWKPKMLSWNKFMDSPVPNDFIDKTLIIPYKNIYNPNTLDDLIHLTEHPINDKIKTSYDVYVNNRNNLIKEKMPWITI